MGDRQDALSRPPGDGWTAWEHEPPPYKPRRVVEVWWADLGNETRYTRVADLPVRLECRGVWWREA